MTGSVSLAPGPATACRLRTRVSHTRPQVDPGAAERAAADLLTNNPDKAAQLEAAGIRVDRRVPTGLHVTSVNGRYLAAKAGRGRHRLSLPSNE